MLDEGHNTKLQNYLRHQPVHTPIWGYNPCRMTGVILHCIPRPHSSALSFCLALSHPPSTSILASSSSTHTYRGAHLHRGVHRLSTSICARATTQSSRTICAISRCTPLLPFCVVLSHPFSTSILPSSSSTHPYSA